MEKVDEEIEKQNKKVEEKIQGENLVELYYHRTLLKQLLECSRLGAEAHFQRGTKIPSVFSADREIPIRKTLQRVEEEIKKKEQEAEKNGPGKK